MVTVAVVAVWSEKSGGSRSTPSTPTREARLASPWLRRAVGLPDPATKVFRDPQQQVSAPGTSLGARCAVDMPFLTPQIQDENDYSLVASLDNVRNLSTVLKAIHFREHATCFATKNGIKVTVENAKCVQANAFIQAGIFQEFIVQEESVTFRINLTVLLDCLSIFGSSPMPGTLTALRMCYQGYGYPLMLFLEEGGVMTVCKINTQEPEETLDFDFCSTNVINKIILQSEGLREAFSELDMTSEVLQITMSPNKPYFRLSTFGNAGSSHLDYPKDSDLMESFQCNQTQVNRSVLNILIRKVRFNILYLLNKC